jgi:hypothetical protein
VPAAALERGVKPAESAYKKVLKTSLRVIGLILQILSVSGTSSCRKMFDLEYRKK